jgi:hypothetical protein
VTLRQGQLFDPAEEDPILRELQAKSDHLLAKWEREEAAERERVKKDRRPTPWNPRGHDAK